MLIPSNLHGKSLMKGPIQHDWVQFVFFIKALQVSTQIIQQALTFYFYQ